MLILEAKQEMNLIIKLKLIAILIVSWCTMVPMIIIADSLTVPPSAISLVQPEKGDLYSSSELQNGQNIYNYSIELGAFRKLEKEKPFMIKLMIKDPLTKNWIEVDKKKFYPKTDRWVNISANLSALTLNLSRNNNFILQKLEYKLVSEKDDRTIFEGVGPEIVANFKNEGWMKRGNGSYDYYVDVCSSISNLSVNILYKKSENSGWNPYTRLKDREFKIYNSSNKDWKRLEWIALPYLPFIKFNPNISLDIIKLK